METPSTLPKVVRFGAFELDVRAGELRRQGRKIKLQDQPFRVLTMLLEQPGQVVTREELRGRIWPGDTFVDFDQGLNKTILKIREALGDDADNPRFVETLPRRGYRFICPVAAVTPQPRITQEFREQAAARESAPEPVAKEQATPPVGVKGETAPRPAVREKPIPPVSVGTERHSKRNVMLALVAAGFIVGAALVLYLMRPMAAPPTVTKVTQLTNDGFAKGFLMATDGVRVYFTEQIGGHWIPVVVSAAGGNRRTIPMPLEDASVLDVSPDGTELLIAETGEPPTELGRLAALPVLGGSPRRIGNIVASEATWSPDGRQILYLRNSPGNFEASNSLYVANSDGTGSRKLVTAPGSPYLIHWSPDGIRISFSVATENSNALWEVSADGRNLHPVLPSWNFPGASCSSHWTPDGKYFLFDSFRGGTDNIWAIREKGGIFEKASREPVRLTTGPMDMGRPVPSRDGKKIFAFGTLPRGELLRSVPKSPRFNPYLGGISAEYLDFSRDGEWIAYVAYPQHTLWKCRVDGSERTQLTFPSLGDVFLPSWSPNGQRIVFEHFPSHSGGIFIIPAEGGNPERLPIESQGGWIDDPGWSPDGKSVVFGYMDPSRKPSYIQRYNLETHQTSKVPGSDGIYSPRVSPDGNYILGETSDTLKLMLLDLRTQNWTVLASPPGGIGWPLWSPGDSDHAYFTTSKNDFTVYRVALANHRIQPFVSWKGIELPNDPYGYVGMGPGNSVFVLRSLASKEIYALDWEAP